MGRTDASIGNTYKCGAQCVWNFRKAKNILKHTNISTQQLNKEVLVLQQNEKQTHGVRTVVSELRGKNIRIQRDKVSMVMKKVVPELVDARNPAKDAYGIRKLPLRCAGPNHCWHYDQHEKMWIAGLCLYAGRDRAAGYMLNVTVLRNKKPQSVMLSVLDGVEHCRTVLPQEQMFDCGTEPVDAQRWFEEHVGPNCVIRTTSQRNNVIELSWRRIHDGCEWIYRVEIYHLEMLLLLDINNPLHIGVFWSSYAHDVQWHLDWFISYGMNNNKMYVTDSKYVYNN